MNTSTASRMDNLPGRPVLAAIAAVLLASLVLAGWEVIVMHTVSGWGPGISTPAGYAVFVVMFGAPLCVLTLPFAVMAMREWHLPRGWADVALGAVAGLLPFMVFVPIVLLTTAFDQEGLPLDFWMEYSVMASWGLIGGVSGGLFYWLAAGRPETTRPEHCPH